MRGISAVIASLLMLIVVIGVASTAYVYFTGVVKARTRTFSVIDSWEDKVLIRNDGDVPIDDIKATLDENPVTTVFDLNDYLVAYWKFNEGSGGKAKDEIQGLEVNLNGQWVDGKFGKAYQFVGSGWVRTSFASVIGSGVSYVFWFKLPDTTDTVGTFFCVQDAYDGTLEDNLGQTPYGDYGCGVSWTYPTYNVNDANWHMYAFSKSSNSILCKDDSCVTLGDATGNIPNINFLYFNGGCGCGYANFGQGIIIDEVRIYNKALTEDEIKALYIANGETVLEPGETVVIKPITTLTKGTHTLRLCTRYVCRTAYLHIF
jgi:hypothetical protein